MTLVTLGSTGITVPKNAFGALPIQRISHEEAKILLRKAYDGGIRFFDTARAYSDSEEKIGLALSDVRENIFIATKTAAKTAPDFWRDLEESLKKLKTDYIDLYQFHTPPFIPKPGGEDGLYDAALRAKREGKIRHIGITNHSHVVAREAIESGLYETLQFPFNYLSGEIEEELVRLCKEKNMGFIAMKAMSGGLIQNPIASLAHLCQYDHVLPIWGIQRERELDDFLAYMDHDPEMTEEMQEVIQKDREELAGDFCRGCGYCMPCPQGIQINQCARMSLMLRRAPSANWLTESWQKEMEKVDLCTGCRKCTAKCPYHLDTPSLLRSNFEDYKRILAGEEKI